jgi:hypothetical protein
MNRSPVAVGYDRENRVDQSRQRTVPPVEHLPADRGVT